MAQVDAQKRQPEWLPYVLPMAAFLAITAFEGDFADKYVWVYFAKIAIVGGLLWFYRATWKDFKIETKWLLPAALVGLVICAQWVWVDKHVAYPALEILGKRTAYNPYEKIPEEGLRWAFLIVRFFGLVVLVPVMEELFWRSFLIRYLTKPEFKELPIGAFSWGAFAIVAALFAAAHPEWLVAAITAVLLGLLLKYSKSLYACLVAHAVANLALGIYVVTQADWKYW